MIVNVKTQRVLTLWLAGLILWSTSALLNSATAQTASSEDTSEQFITPNLGKCDFAVDFPSRPLVDRKCPPEPEGAEDESKACQYKVEFTKVYIGEATVTVTAICNPAQSADLEKYSEPEMKATVERRAEERSVTTYQTYTGQTESGEKYAILTGGRQKATGTDIVMTQIWISDESFFSISGTIEGRSSEAIDQDFSRIMRSVRKK